MGTGVCAGWIGAGASMVWGASVTGATKKEIRGALHGSLPQPPWERKRDCDERSESRKGLEFGMIGEDYCIGYEGGEGLCGSTSVCGFHL